MTIDDKRIRLYLKLLKQIHDELKKHKSKNTVGLLNSVLIAITEIEDDLYDAKQRQR